jgi:dihydrodipicolinate synthase/N-acetylneuraminate lyase
LIAAADVRGVTPALVTPLTKNDQVDLKGVETITKYLVDSGVHGPMPVGGTGEFPSLLRGPLPELTDEEKAGVKAALKTIGAS